MIPNYIMRRKEVLHSCGISNSTLHRLINAGLFPVSLTLGTPGKSRSVGWYSNEVEDWVNSRSRTMEVNTPAIHDEGDV